MDRPGFADLGLRAARRLVCRGGSRVMSYDWLTILLALIAIVIVWKVFKGIVKTVALVVILAAAAIFVFGGLG